MTQGELNLYRNTYNAGKRDALEEYVDRAKKTIERDFANTDSVPKKALYKILDQYLEEAIIDRQEAEK